MSLRLYYYKAREGNFGDDLNRWIWERLAPGVWEERSETIFLGIGTIIGNPMPPARKAIVFSSGFGYSRPPADWGSERWEVAAVRGPLTARALGLAEESVVADGALLLRFIPEFAPIAESKRRGVVFVPHHFAARFGEWAKVAAGAGVEMVDPREESRRVIHRLRAARLVLADSMHAAVIADLLRVPWVSVATSPEFSTFKWLDWSIALGLKLETTVLVAPSLRTAYDGWAIRLLHLDHLVQPISLEGAFAKQAMAVAPRSGRKATFMRAGPARTFGHHLGRLVTQRMDVTRCNRTADQLREVARGSGSLSSESIVQAKAEELLERLRAVVAKHGSRR